MSSVGTYLRELRQRKGVSLEEIARTTRVAQRYLASLEADAFDALPSPVFTRGFIRAYCQAVSEPPEEALAAYESRVVDSSTAPGVATRAGTMAVRSAPSAARSTGGPASRTAADNEARGRGAVLVSFVLLVVLGVALFAVALVIHPRDRERLASTSRPEPRAESRPVRAPDDGAPPSSSPASAPPAARPAPSPAPATSAPPTAAMPPTPTAPALAPRPTSPTTAVTAAPTSTPTPSTAAAPGVPAPTAPRPAPVIPSAAPAGTAATPGPVPTAPSPSAAPNLDAAVGSVVSPYRLIARTNEATWIRIRTDDGRTSEENVPAGEVREWVSNRPFVLTIGNAGGVSLELNGRALPPLGPKGSVIQRMVLPPEPR